MDVKNGAGRNYPQLGHVNPLLSTAAQYRYLLFEVVCIKFVPNFRFRAAELKKIVIADRQKDTYRQMDRQTDSHT